MHPITFPVKMVKFATAFLRRVVRHADNGGGGASSPIPSDARAAKSFSREGAQNAQNRNSCFVPQ
jgi:hypothetical protein